jgi:predicted transcriptional regulator
VEPSARVQIPAPALQAQRLSVSEACFRFRVRQPPYRLDQRVLGHPRHVQAHPASGLQNSAVDVQTGRHLTIHATTSIHMVPCAKGPFIGHQGKDRGGGERALLILDGIRIIHVMCSLIEQIIRVFSYWQKWTITFEWIFNYCENISRKRVECMSKRSWPTIVIDILEAALIPTNKTRIMYKSNLNFERFDKYFSDLLRKKLVEEMYNANGNRVYKATKRGRILLKTLRNARELFSSAR